MFLLGFFISAFLSLLFSPTFHSEDEVLLEGSLVCLDPAAVDAVVARLEVDKPEHTRKGKGQNRIAVPKEAQPCPFF